MQLGNLVQPPFSCTLMGALSGALSYFGAGIPAERLYGATGHAFVLNIHKALCPSGPYCWDTEPMEPLIANVGLQREPLGFYHLGSTPEERAAVEAKLRAALTAGTPCMLLNMDNQLITGWDDTGFLTAQPWGDTDYPPKHLTFGTWSELGREVHICFHALRRCEPAVAEAAVIDSLRYAVDLWRQPDAHTSADYGMGPNGYANWLDAVAAGHGAGHGAWWNATVWAECRAMAAEYCRSLAPTHATEVDAAFLGAEYAAIASLLGQCANKELGTQAKIALLEEASAREEACIVRLEAMLGPRA